jgi:peptidoglycan-N-acetylglucosamine deacetylase
MYLVRTPRLVQSLMPNLTWRIPTEEKVLFLTFDDGPIPEVTPWVVEQLEKFSAKATFFCVGENIKKHFLIFEKLISAGHSVGNHTFSHLNGWETDNLPYFQNVRKAAHLVKTNLFRPPYGRLMPSQSSFLQRHYQIVMWDVLAGDFDPDLSAENCLDNVISNVRPGSIVVLHDSLKAEKNLRFVLPQVLEYFSKAGWKFEALNMNRD